MPVSAAGREAFVDWIVASKDWETKVYRGEHAMTYGVDRIPLPNPMLTRAMQGGVPIGHIVRDYGEEGSGKSLKNLGLIYNAHNYPEIITETLEREIYYWEAKKLRLKAMMVKSKLEYLLNKFPDGMSVLIYDTEQRFTWDLAERLGINTRNKDNLVVLEENIIENIAFQMEEAVASFHIIIIDSVSNAESFAEANLKPGEYERGTAAAAWKRLRRVRSKLDRTENTIILVDQVRAGLGKQVFKGGKMEQAPPEPPQIRFLKHNASVAVRFSQGKKLYMMDDGNLTDDYKKGSDDFKALGSDGKEVAGLEMRCKVEKNSVGAPFRNASMRFCFPVMDVRTGELIQDVGFDLPYELLMSAEHYHIVESGGGGMFYPLTPDFERIPKGKGKGHIGWKGEPLARQMVAEDDEIRERVLERLMLDR